MSKIFRIFAYLNIKKIKFFIMYLVGMRKILIFAQ